MPLFCCVLDAERRRDSAVLDAIARASSPRIQVGWRSARGANARGRRASEATACAVLFDVSGLQRVLGPPAAIAAEVARLCASEQLTPRLAIAATMTTAWLAVHAQNGVTVIRSGEEAAALADISLDVLGTLRAIETPEGNRSTVAIRDPIPECLATLRRWGLRTLGDLARLPEAEVRTRLGAIGARLHQAARGLDDAPLVAAAEPVTFCERIVLEWPIEGVEPLSFVLGRLCDSLAAALEHADRGAVAIETRLRLVTRVTHERVLHLPAPMRDPRVLRTLILLDLESHPPPAAIDVVEIQLDVTPSRIVQGSLLSRSLPPAEELATLVARLRALMGETRVGAPALVDSHDERAFGMKEFAPPSAERAVAMRRAALDALPDVVRRLPMALRRFRLPIAVTVEVAHGAPVRVTSGTRGLPGGPVSASAGPSRSSGHWWKDAPRRTWDRDEWEVELANGVYRLSRDRVTGRWEIEGVFD
jgi:protein ImuB